MVKLIKDDFYVKSKTTKQIYKVDRDLRCSCQGYKRHKHCRHQKEVQDYINSGEWIDISVR